MLKFFEHGLHSRIPAVRKGSAFALLAPKQIVRICARPADYAASPPVLANSFPKSGTHLLDQIVAALPACRNYGAFLSSMTSSFRFSPRSAASSTAFILGAAPGEILRAHLHFDEAFAASLRQRNVVHYFIYRDPRDVVLSEAHYLRSGNRWHRLHPFFRDAKSLEEAITLAIRGLPRLAPAIDYPDVGARFRRSADWIGHPEAFAVRYEDLMSQRRGETLRAMAQFYAARSTAAIDVDVVALEMDRKINPQRSHTYRKGKAGGWREVFTDEHNRLFEEVAGAQLRRFGFV